MIHYLKILPEYFRAVARGRKRFEIRRDEGFKVGDVLVLQEWHGAFGHTVGESGFTGRRIRCRVTYRTTFEQQPGFVVLGISVYET